MSDLPALKAQFGGFLACQKHFPAHGLHTHILSLSLSLVFENRSFGGFIQGFKQLFNGIRD
jgi:hypothetical protein